MILLLLASCTGPEEGPEPFGIAHQESCAEKGVTVEILATTDGPVEAVQVTALRDGLLLVDEALEETASAEWVVSLSLATLAGSCKEATAWDWLLVGVSEDGRTVESPVFWSPE